MKCWPFSEKITQNNSCEDQLREEGVLLSIYLVNLQPSKYILEKYINAHRSVNFHMLSFPNKFDKFLLAIIKKHHILLKLADVYTSTFARTSLLRRKLVLLLALFESCAETHILIDGISEYSKLIFCARCFLRALGFSFLLLISLFIFSLPHAISSTNFRIHILIKDG